VSELEVAVDRFKHCSCQRQYHWNDRWKGEERVAMRFIKEWKKNTIVLDRKTIIWQIFG